MNRDNRKISRTYEERSILASTTRVSQISQADNELRQKLQAINTSHKLSNKRIRNETRELKEILHGLQKELKLSKGNYGHYIPSLIEEPQRKPRRTTVSSVPSEDVKEIGLERDLHGRNVERILDNDATSRRRSGSYPPSLHAYDAKKAKDGLNEQVAQNKPDKVLEKTGGKVSKDDEQTQTSQQIGSWQSHRELNGHGQSRTEFPDIELDKYPQRRISQTERRLTERSFKEQQQGERKRSTSEALRGRFVLNTDTNYSDTTLSSPMRRTSQTQQKGEGTRARLRPSVVEEFSSVPSLNEQRKTSFGMPQHPWQRKGNVGDRRGSPMAGSPGRYDSHDAEVVFDALPDYLGGRRLSVAHGRVRKVPRGTGLPPLREEGTSQKSQQSTKNWSDLSKCRYLRKEEQEISIDDIFSKE